MSIIAAQPVFGTVEDPALHGDVVADDASEYRSIENPSFAVNPAQLDALWGYGPTRSGVQVNEHTAITFGAVFTALKILAESLAMLPLITYQGDPDSNDRKKATWSPVYNLLRRAPNSEMTAATWKETQQNHLVGWGNFYARIRVDNNHEPLDIVPMLPDRTYIERVRGQLQYVSNANDGGQDRFAPEEVIHVPLFGFNGLKGYSPIAHAREMIATGLAQQFYGATFFGNGATVGGTLESPGMLPPEKIAALRESWNAMHAGVGNSHKTAILWGGVKYNRVGIPPEEAQWIEAQKFSVNQIAMIYRIPPHMLGATERTARGNVEQDSLNFLTQTLAPYLHKWEDELTRKLFPDDPEYFVRFDEKALLRTDLMARQNYYAILRQWGVYSANNVCNDEGLEKIPKEMGGDERIVPVNYQNTRVLVGQTTPAPSGKNLDPESPNGGAAADGTRPGKREQAQVMRPVLIDALSRMLAKESKAASRGNADEEFYQSHRQHVREALRPAATTLNALMGFSHDSRSISAIEAAIGAVADTRGAADAGALADRVIASIAGVSS